MRQNKDKAMNLFILLWSFVAGECSVVFFGFVWGLILKRLFGSCPIFDVKYLSCHYYHGLKAETRKKKHLALPKFELSSFAEGFVSEGIVW